MQRAMRLMMGVWVICGCLDAEASAGQIGVGDFHDPMVFDFTELSSSTHLGAGNPNPYAASGVEFTGFVVTTNYEGIQGNHLASGFANTPAEPFVVRVRLLDDPALRVGAYVWPEYGSSTSITAFDDLGSIIETYSVHLSTGTSFMGLQSTLDQPIRYVEWRGLAGSSLTTFPRVDGVRIDTVPEPATLSLLALGAACVLPRRRYRASAQPMSPYLPCPKKMPMDPPIPSRKNSARVNRLRAVALTLTMSLVLATSTRADVWFLGVGNDGYYTDIAGVYNAYTQLPNLHETPIHSRLLSNHGGSTISSDIGWLSTNAQPGDLAIFFYSGHGDTTYDYNHDETAGWSQNGYDEILGSPYNWITDDQVTGALSGIDPTVPVIAIFDMCYAGGMVGGGEDLNSLPNVFVMMSSLEDQLSYGGATYSRFAEQLINGLGSGLPADTNYDGTVTFDEWFGYTPGRVYGQTPQYFDAGTFGSLPIVPVPEPGTALLLAAGGCALLRMQRLALGRA